jgi:hypothetical protein
MASKVTAAIILFIYLVLGAIIYNLLTPDTVYSCADKERNPPDIQAQCKQLTKNQWWGAYYEGKR